MGYSDEVIKEIDIREEIDLDLNQPYVLLVEKKFNTSPLSRDSEFNTERGMITKEYKRNLSLQQLDLEPNQILWILGQGSGKCGQFGGLLRKNYRKVKGGYSNLEKNS